MPKMNGKEAYDRLKSKGILDETIEYIAKPILPRNLLKKVRELLDEETLKKAPIS